MTEACAAAVAPAVVDVARRLVSCYAGRCRANHDGTLGTFTYKVLFWSCLRSSRSRVGVYRHYRTGDGRARVPKRREASHGERPVMAGGNTGSPDGGSSNGQFEL
jgi:hypothetical protein